LIIIDSNQIRGRKLFEKCQSVLPDINIYWCFSFDNNEYECFYRKSNGQLFDRQSQPINGCLPKLSTLALWHSSDSKNKPEILSEISIGFRGGKIRQQSNFRYNLLKELDADTIESVMTNEKIQEFWNWACDSGKKPLKGKLPSLIYCEDPALIALQIICQLYLKFYADIELRIDKDNFKNVKDLWLSTFDTVENLEHQFAEHAKKIDDPITELIQSLSKIQSMENFNFWTVSDRQKLKQICLRCLKISIA
jgi:hypothetical protein